jgi:hypothetical protein
VIPFPAPSAVIAGRNFWTKGEVRKWIAAVAGQPEPAPQPDDEILLTSRQVRDLFGGVSEMWLHRRRFPDGVASPQPLQLRAAAKRSKARGGQLGPEAA